ncbi:MAG: ABC transporter substrate-binding protein [Methylotenera sp.]|nr:ABC transporter substrate-binding protein [Oligoflexia bacterium]
MSRKNQWIAVALAMSMTAISGCKKSANTVNGISQNNNSAAGDVIKLGEVGSMTGSEATFGTSTHQGILLAVKIINAAGGVKGKQFSVTSLDDQGKPEEAATAVTKLINQNNVSAILGEVASSRSLAMAPIAQQNKVLMITPSSTNPKVTEQGDHIFRVCFIDPFQGTVMAKFATETLKLKKVAILRDVKNDYSVGLANYFKETFVKAGGTIVVDQSYSAGDIDFKSQLTAIRAKAPEAIFVPGYYTEVGLIGRQARELGLKVPLMGGDGWDSPKLKEIGGAAMDGSYFSNHYSEEDKSPVVQDFISKYKADYGVVPDGLAAMGYDAVVILADAMKRAPTLNTEDVRKALLATRDFPGVTGKININDKRDAVKSAVVLKVENGVFKYQTTVNP